MASIRAHPTASGTTTHPQLGERMTNVEQAASGSGTLPGTYVLTETLVLSAGRNVQEALDEAVRNGTATFTPEITCGALWFYRNESATCVLPSGHDGCHSDALHGDADHVWATDAP